MKLLEWQGGKGGDQILEEQTRLRSDAKMVTQAIKNRWPISDELKERLMQQGQQWLYRCNTARDYAAVAAIVMSAERQNQVDHHQAEEYARLDAGKPTGNVQHIVRSDTPILAKPKFVESKEIGK